MTGEMGNFVDEMRNNEMVEMNKMKRIAMVLVAVALAAGTLGAQQPRQQRQPVQPVEPVNKIQAANGAEVPMIKGANDPIGEAKGIFPDRVVWTHAPGAARRDAGHRQPRRLRALEQPDGPAVQPQPREGRRH